MYSPSKDKKCSTQKFYGNYRGEVVDVEDPNNAGRVRVMVYGVFDGLSVETLPWAIYADPFMGGQSDIGGFYVPDKNSKVWVFFEGGDHTMPVYFAGAPSRKDSPSEGRDNQYPHNRVFKTKAGHIIEIDDSDGKNRIRVHHSSVTDAEIDNDGNVTQHVVGDVDQTIDGDVEQLIKGDVTQTVNGDVTQTVDGDVDQTVQGNVDRTINGNLTEKINGNYKRTVGGTVDDESGGKYSIRGSRIDLNE